MFSSRKSSAPASGGLTKSLRFRGSASAYLNRTPASAGNRTTWTWSVWVKRGSLSSLQGMFTAGSDSPNPRGLIEFEAADTIRVGFSDGTTFYLASTTAVFRDPSSWYHIVVAFDLTNGTNANRVKLYVNNVLQSFASTPTWPTSAQVFNNNVVHRIGCYYGATPSNFFDGYMTEVNFIDGQALTPSSFGATNATTGQWSPATYSGTYGTNGFHLTFANTTSTTTLGYDTSGNSNNWTTNNISLTAGSTYDSMNDVPVAYSATASNYAVMNPLVSSTGTNSQGNLSVSTASVNASPATIFANTGKWYWEVVWVSGGNYRIGVCNSTGAGQDLGGSANGWAKINSPPRVYNNGSAPSYGTDGSVGDTFMVALDLDAGKIWYGINGTWQASGSPSTGANPSQTFTANQTMSPAVASGSGTLVYNPNFGQQPFTYTPPSGYLALNTYNIATGTVTTTGTFTGNSSTDGPFVYLNGTPTAMTINANIVTFGTDANKLANGFKVINSSSLYNLSGTNTYIVTTSGAVLKVSNAQSNP